MHRELYHTKGNLTSKDKIRVLSLLWNQLHQVVKGRIAIGAIMPLNPALLLHTHRHTHSNTHTDTISPLLLPHTHTHTYTHKHTHTHPTPPHTHTHTHTHTNTL